MKYRKKPVVIDAIQWNGQNIDEIKSFVGKSLGYVEDEEIELYIFTPEGTMMARINDYIIRGVKGEFYPCNPDIFEMTYDFDLIHLEDNSE